MGHAGLAERLGLVDDLPPGCRSGWSPHLDVSPGPSRWIFSANSRCLYICGWIRVPDRLGAVAVDADDELRCDVDLAQSRPAARSACCLSSTMPSRTLLTCSPAGSQPVPYSLRGGYCSRCCRRSGWGCVLLERARARHRGSCRDFALKTELAPVELHQCPSAFLDDVAALQGRIGLKGIEFFAVGTDSQAQLQAAA